MTSEGGCQCMAASGNVLRRSGHNDGSWRPKTMTTVTFANPGRAVVTNVGCQMAISILLVRALVSAVELAGVDRTRLLEGTRFDADVLADISGRITVAEYDALVER